MKKLQKLKRKMLRKMQKVPPEAEVAIGAGIIAVPPIPTPDDVIGIALIADGARRLRKKYSGKVKWL